MVWVVKNGKESVKMNMKKNLLKLSNELLQRIGSDYGVRGQSREEIAPEDGK